MQSVATGKVRVIHWARGAHHLTIFQVWKQKGIVRALRKLASCETLVEEPSWEGRRRSMIMFSKYNFECILGLDICNNIMDTVKNPSNACFSITIPTCG